MKTKEESKQPMVRVPQSDLLSLVADKLKDKILFPEKIEKAKAFLNEVKISAII